jgi:16S rRNA processing protein RimM
MKKIYICTIVNTKGWKGTMVADDLAANISLIPEGTDIYIGFSEKFNKKYKLESWTSRSNKTLIKIEGVNSSEEAANFKEQGVFLSEEDHSRITGENKTLDQIYDFKVFDANDKTEIGILKDVWILPANDVWLVETENGPLPLPVTDEVIKQVDIKNKSIYVNMIPGLDDLTNQKEDEI